MKTCPKCGSQIEDNNLFCHVCGTNLDNPVVVEQGMRPTWDHTDEFSAEDVRDNKVVAMIMYLSGLYGTLICFAILWLVGKGKSDYLFFHVKENFKITLVDTLLVIFAVFFFWTVVIPIAAAICGVIIMVLRFICFVQVAKNQSKEVAIIRGLKFLK